MKDGRQKAYAWSSRTGQRKHIVIEDGAVFLHREASASEGHDLGDPAVVCSPAGNVLWLIAQHGAHAGWVRNFQESPQVRVRIGRRWLTGTAQLVSDDDVKARIATFAGTTIGRAVTAASFRALESQPVSVRIELAA
ncbi:MAG TPA: nitroreductase/quinone reductase family protein [Solirubrobacteraceae bacterium]